MAFQCQCFKMSISHCGAQCQYRIFKESRRMLGWQTTSQQKNAQISLPIHLSISLPVLFFLYLFFYLSLLPLSSLPSFTHLSIHRHPFTPFIRSLIFPLTLFWVCQGHLTHVVGSYPCSQRWPQASLKDSILIHNRQAVWRRNLIRFLWDWNKVL